MRITNYNSAAHDIYTFNESVMVLVSVLPPTVNENLNNRVKAPIRGYNNAGLWNLSLGDLTVPDWSGLHARNRGSNSYGTPNDGYAPPLNPQIGYYGDTAPYSYILNHQNWNNREAPLYLISPKHFLACRHFTGPATQSVQIRLLGKDGVYVYRTGTQVGNSGDLTLYQFEDQLTAPELVQVQPYQIVDPLTVPVNTAFWKQTPNGSFTAYQNTGATILPHESLVSYNSVNQDFPVDEGTYWVGDSGSPLLVTKNGQTYLYGASNLSGLPNVHFGDDATWAWLAPLITNAGVTSRVNLGLEVEVSTEGSVEVSTEGYALKLKIKENALKVNDKTGHYSLRITPTFSLDFSKKPNGVILQKHISSEVYKTSTNANIVISKIDRTEIYNLPT